MSTVQAVLRWLAAISKHWIGIVTGGVLVGALSLYSGLKAITIPPRLYEAVALIAVLQAMFLAWREEEAKHLEAETKRIDEEVGRSAAERSIGGIRPDFQIELLRLLPRVQEGIPFSSLYLEVSLRNLGTPSAATNWRIAYASLTGPSNQVGDSLFSSEQHCPVDLTGPNLYHHDASIETFGQRHGWLGFILMHTLEAFSTMIVQVKVDDVAGNTYSVEKRYDLQRELALARFFNKID